MKPRLLSSSNTTKPALSTGEVRIIGGQWKRSKLPVLPKPGLRPTPDRVRETLFNWLGQDLSGLRCLDAFAGTGALGFEAASRGAAQVLLVEQDADLIQQLQANAKRLKADAIQIQRGDGIAVLQRMPPASQDVVFLDPPFAQELFAQGVEAASGIITEQGAIYLEAPEAWDDAGLESLQLAKPLKVLKKGRAGAVYFHLFGRGA